MLVNKIICQKIGHIKHIFEAKIIGGSLSLPEEEIEEAKWFAIDEMKHLTNIIDICIAYTSH